MILDIVAHVSNAKLIAVSKNSFDLGEPNEFFGYVIKKGEAS